MFFVILQCDPGWVRTDMAGPKATKSPEEGTTEFLFSPHLPPLIILHVLFEYFFHSLTC